MFSEAIILLNKCPRHSLCAINVQWPIIIDIRRNMTDYSNDYKWCNALFILVVWYSMQLEKFSFYCGKCVAGWQYYLANQLAWQLAVICWPMAQLASTKPQLQHRNIALRGVFLSGSAWPRLPQRGWLSAPAAASLLGAATQLFFSSWLAYRSACMAACSVMASAGSFNAAGWRGWLANLGRKWRLSRTGGGVMASTISQW